MIVYDKLGEILKERNLQWKDLCKAGISVNTPTRFSKNRATNTEIIDKVCEFLRIQPGDFMEWIPSDEYNHTQYEKTEAGKAALKQQIEELQKKLDSM